MQTYKDKLNDLLGQIELRLDLLSAKDYPNKLQPFARPDAGKFAQAIPAICHVILKLETALAPISEALDVSLENPPESVGWLTQQVIKASNSLGDTDKEDAEKKRRDTANGASIKHQARANKGSGATVL